MLMWEEIATVIGFGATFLATLLIGMTVIRARQRVRNIADVHTWALAPRPGRFRFAMAGAIPMLPGELGALEQDLRRAGYYSTYASVEYLATRNLLVVAMMILGGLAAIAADPDTQLPKYIAMTTAVVSLLLYIVPRSILHAQANKRLGRIQRGLPDALDIIRMCLTGGLPLRDSLERVSQEVEFFHPDIAVELEVVRRHAEADTMQKALREFARRMNAPDVTALASLVSQTERTGTHVAAAVTEFADGIRRQSRQRAEERANKTTIAMLFPVVLCLAPPVFILLMGPPLLQLRNFVRDAHKAGGVLEIPTDINTSPANANRANRGT